MIKISTRVPYVIDRSIPPMEMFEKLPEDVRAEVIDGRLYVSPVPNTDHEQINTDLGVGLWNYVKRNDLGRVFVTAVGVFHNNETEVVSPDISFRAKSNKRCMIEKKGMYGPPDLCIEVLSTNRRHDLVIKKVSTNASELKNTGSSIRKQKKQPATY